ncbi:MAG: sigma-70 family RNA polymerase sigma factor [Bacteroidota bacterium]
MLKFAITLFIGVILGFIDERLNGYSIAQLIKRYKQKKENEVAMELLGRYNQQDEQTQGEIISSLLIPHWQDLSRIIASMKEEPQEELQKLFLKLHKLFKQDKFPKSNWKYWLARIVKNDLINKKKRKNPFIPLPVEELTIAAPETNEADRINPNKLKEAISKLAAKQKQVVELRYLRSEGKLMTYKEIADHMNCSVGQVHGYLDRAKENLRTHLNGPFQPK